MKHLTATHYLIGIAVLVTVGLASIQYFNAAQSPKVANAEDLAVCIAESDATFYGAYWCPHCADQKAMFGNAAELLPYVECSLPNRDGQTDECRDAGITGYPTWEFADGERVSGVMTMADLATRTNCPLPQSE